MSGEVPKVDQAACSHKHIYHSEHEDNGVVHSEHWYCKDCQTEFFPLPKFFAPGPLTVMEPEATLRDQFAMAAMTGDMGNDDGVFANSTTDKRAAERYYQIADAMMEARKT